MAVSVPTSGPPPELRPPTGAPAVNAGLLGLQEHETDDLKQAAVSIMQEGQGRAKKPKLTHSLFFNDEKGLHKVIQTFPKIRFQGKGHEFGDLKLLIRHYEKWFRELFPSDDNFEDLVWRARSVLQEKEKADDGTLSDPREQLHRVRYEYKASSGVGTKAEQARLRAAASKKAAAAEAAEELRQRMQQTRDLDVETLWKIEEKRAQALELRRKRQAEQAAKGASGSQTQSSRASQEDVFGFGGGLDGSQGSGVSQRVAQALAKAASQSQGSKGSQDDVFGFGFGLDGSQASGGTQRSKAGSAQAAGRARSQHSQSQEDVFGFGFGMDGSQTSSAASQLKATQRSQAAAPAMGAEETPGISQLEPGQGQGQAELSEELQRKIDANRQRALEVQRKRRAEEQPPERRVPEADADVDVQTLLKIEENRVKALELRRKKQAQRAARSGGNSQSQSQSQSQTQSSAPSQATQESLPRSPAAASQVDPNAFLSQLEGASQTDVFGFGFGLDASQAAPPSQPLPAASSRLMPPPLVVPRTAKSSQRDGLSQSQSSQPPHTQGLTQGSQADAAMSQAAPGAPGEVDASQADVFGFGFGLDASQVPSQPAPSQPAPSQPAPTGSQLMPPPPVPVMSRASQRQATLPATTVLEMSQSGHPAQGDFLGMSQPDVFGFGGDLDMSQAPPAAPPALEERRGAAAPARASDDAMGLPTMSSSMLSSQVALSQPDIFGFGFDLDPSQAEAPLPGTELEDSTGPAQGGQS